MHVTTQVHGVGEADLALHCIPARLQEDRIFGHISRQNAVVGSGLLQAVFIQIGQQRNQRRRNTDVFTGHNQCIGVLRTGKRSGVCGVSAVEDIAVGRRSRVVQVQGQSVARTRNHRAAVQQAAVVGIDGDPADVVFRGVAVEGQGHVLTRGDRIAHLALCGVEIAAPIAVFHLDGALVNVAQVHTAAVGIAAALIAVHDSVGTLGIAPAVDYAHVFAAAGDAARKDAAPDRSGRIQAVAENAAAVGGIAVHSGVAVDIFDQILGIVLRHAHQGCAVDAAIDKAAELQVFDGGAADIGEDRFSGPGGISIDLHIQGLAAAVKASAEGKAVRVGACHTGNGGFHRAEVRSQLDGFPRKAVPFSGRLQAIAEQVPACGVVDRVHVAFLGKMDGVNRSRRSDRHVFRRHGQRVSAYRSRA